MGKYTELIADEQGVEYTEILEDGHISSSNIVNMGFEFSRPVDITANLDKRNARNPNPDIPQNPGRTGFTSMTVKYPNGETSSKAVFKECVIQYREAMLRENGRDYGSTYICLGIPTAYLETIFRNARNNNIHMENREKTREKSGYYWVDCDIRRLGLSDVCIFYEQGGEAMTINKSIREILMTLRQNVECTVTLSISGNITNRNKNEDLPLDRGVYHPSIKLSEIVVLKDSNVESPDLSEFATQAKNEKSEKSEASIAKGKVLEMALGRLKIG